MNRLIRKDLGNAGFRKKAEGGKNQYGVSTNLTEDDYNKVLNTIPSDLQANWQDVWQNPDSGTNPESLLSTWTQNPTFDGVLTDYQRSVMMEVKNNSLQTGGNLPLWNGYSTNNEVFRTYQPGSQVDMRRNK